MGTIGDVIARHHSEILRMWTQTAQQSPSARELTGPEVASTIPAYLSLLGKGDGVRLSDEQRQLVEHHLSTRLRSGFNLNEILTEFASLGRYVFQYVDEVESPLSDIPRLSAQLLLTSTEVTKIFYEQLLEDEQTLKRYTRLLHNIASEAVGFHENALPVRERLNKALALVMEAMGAETAALLLLDASSNELIMSASTGDAHEHLAEHVSSLDAATYAGKIASIEGEAIAVSDSETTQLEVTEPLRNSGIHSLLGMRLSAHHLLRGVVYIGIREKRAFTASEVRRLESLSETLTVHLDNAQLYSALRQTTDRAAVAEQLRERFVSVLMRDLKGPLTAARATAQHLFDTSDNPQAAAKIAHSLDHMQRMIDELLDSHRIRAGERVPLTI